jgi:hypothetical protein
MIRDQDDAVRYASVNAAVDMRSMQPMLRIALAEMRRQGADRTQPELYQQTMATRELLEDRDELRRRLEAAQSPDGSVMFTLWPGLQRKLRRAGGSK